MSVNIGKRQAVSGRKWGAAFGIALHQTTTVHKLFRVPVWWPPSWIRSQLCHRGRHDQVGRGRKCGCIAVGIKSVDLCRLKLKLQRPEEKLTFFNGGCLWFSRSLKVLEKATFKRKTPKHPELDPLGTGFDRILKFARGWNFSRCRRNLITPPRPRPTPQRKPRWAYVDALWQLGGHVTFHMNDHVNQRRKRRPSCYCLVVIKSVNRLSEAFGKLHFLVGLSQKVRSARSCGLHQSTPR